MITNTPNMETGSRLGTGPASIPPSSPPPKKNSNVVYFLVGCIALLIGTNIFVYLKKNETTQKLVTQVAQVKDEKSAIQAELSKLESDLATATNSTTKLTSDLQAKDTELKEKIAQLQAALHQKNISAKELARAKEDINQLRTTIHKYSSDIATLKEQNEHLNTENTTLKTRVDSVSRNAAELQSKNEDLSKKVNEASALKARAMEITPLKVKSSGKETSATRASKISKIRITFALVDNNLYQEGNHDVYLILTDPNGKLVSAADSSATFHSNSDGQDMPYTSRSTISYSKANKAYSIIWTKSTDFVPGVYKVVLYSDGYKLGESSFKLRKGGLF